MNFDLMIKNVHIVSSSATVFGNVLVRDGKVVGIIEGDLAESLSADTVIEGEGRYLLPGMVDVHVHIDEQWKDIEFDMAPYRPVDDDIASATKAAAAGGITTVSLMPATFPLVNTAELLQGRRAYYEGRSYVDFALLGGAGVEMLDTIVPQAEAGAIGYKSYYRHYSAARKGLVNESSADVYQMMKKVRDAGRPVAVHSEDAFLSTVLTKELQAAGRTDPQAYLPSRPNATEILSTLLLLEVALFTGAPLHLVHMSVPRAIELAALWQEWGTDVTIETCPHYLLFSNDDMDQWGAYMKVAPPLRNREDVEGMWDLLREGYIDILASDHAPGYDEERESGARDIFSSGGGMPALETTIPPMLFKVAEGKLTLNKLVEISAENPAQRFHMFPQKGTIRPGSDADFMLVDMEKTHTLLLENMFSRGKEGARPYHGMSGKGVIKKTILGGRVIYSDGEILGSPTDGKFVSASS